MNVWQELLGGFAEGFLLALDESPSPSPIQNRVIGWCQELGWTVEVLEGPSIRLAFQDALVGIRRVLIQEGDNSVIHFLALSHAFLPAKDVPREVLGHLLARNREITIGTWGGHADDDGDAVFAVRYHAPADSLHAPLLRHICLTLLSEASGFDEKMHQARLLRLT